MVDNTRIPSLTTGAIVSADGRPLPGFKGWTNRAFARIEQNVKNLQAQLGLIAAAQATADAALDAATAAGSDGIIDANEKFTSVIPTYAVIIAEQSGLDSQASAYGIIAEKSAYDTAITNLTTYLATLTTPKMWNDKTGNTNVVRADWDTKWNAVKTTKQTLQNKIDDVSGTRSTWTGVTGTGRPADNATVNRITRSTTAPGTPIDGDIWVDTSVTPNITRVRVSGAWQISANYTTNTNQLTDGANLGVTATWSSVTGVGRPEDSADITRWIDGPVQSGVFLYGPDGVAQSGQLGRAMTFKLLSPSGQTTSGITWTYAVLSGSVNGFNNLSSAQTMSGSGTGTLTVSSLGATVTTVKITATFASQVLVKTITLSKLFAPPTNQGTFASKSSYFFGSGSGTSDWDVVTGGGTGLTATMPAGKTSATISVNLSVEPYGNGPTNITMRVARVISGTTTTIGSSGGTQMAIFDTFEKTMTTANFVFQVTDTGLTAGASYSWMVLITTTFGSGDVNGMVTIAA